MSGPIVEFEEVAGVTVASFRIPDLFEEYVEQIRPQMLELARQPSRRVLFDLAGVRFLGSAALGLMIQVAMKLTGHGGRLAMCNVSEDVARILRAPPRLVSACPIFPDRVSALQALAGG